MAKISGPNGYWAKVPVVTDEDVHREIDSILERLKLKSYDYQDAAAAFFALLNRERDRATDRMLGILEALEKVK